MKLTLGETLKDRRRELSLTLREVARRVEVAPSYISDIEHDRRIPSEDILQVISKVLGIEIDELMSLAGRFGEECERYMKRNPESYKLLRVIARCNLNTEQIAQLMTTVEKMKHRK